jgi:subtilase family serine protease
MNDLRNVRRASKSSPMRSARSVILALSLALAALLGFAPATRAQAVRQLVTQPIDERQSVELEGNTRPEANADNDRGPVADTLVLEHMQLLLQRPPETEAALTDLIERLHDEDSPDFHHWLDNQKLRDEFGPVESDVDTVTTWLSSHGMTVHGVRQSGMLIDFSGTAAQVRDTFHTEIHSLEVNGAARIANMSNPRIPVALAGLVKGVVSLNDFPAHPQFTPAPQYTTAPYSTSILELPGYAVVPGDLWTIYNFNPLLKAGITGKGQTVTVVEDTNMYNTADWTTFRKTFGLSGYSGASLTQVHPAPGSGTNNCSNPGVTSDSGEATLDVEWASAAAPDAAIVLASCKGTNTTYGFLIAAQNLVDASEPPAIVSMSYGECEGVLGAAANGAFNTAFKNGTAKGMSFFVSSGDQLTGVCNGDLSEKAVTDGVSVNGMASTPYNVAAGGTDFADAAEESQTTYWSGSNSSTYASAKKYLPEVPWNNSCASPLVAHFLGYSTTYGSEGSCNGTKYPKLLNNSGGSGGPSSCATGAPAKGGVSGGTCKGWPKPSWQKSLVGNPADNVRDLPDVSLFASTGMVWGHAYIYCYSDLANQGATCSGEPPVKWSAAGGTSFVAPILAGIQALVNQKKGAKQGNPNAVYYALAKTEYGTKGSSTCNSSNARPTGPGVGESCIFNDITGVFSAKGGTFDFGSNDAPCTNVAKSTVLTDCYRPSGTNGVLSTSNSSFDPTYPTTTGWDFATGIGSINVTNLVNNW